jgi:myo-inositol-1(or 4)-monophosphatase
MQAVAAAKKAGAFIKDNLNRVEGADIEYKGIHDFVTYVDKTSEKMLVEMLTDVLPGAGFLVEEKSVEQTNNNLYWIIDPLDGTTNYVHRLAPYAVSIALMEDNEIVAGVVYEIGAGECFYTWKNAPSFLNGEEIKVSDRKILKDSLIATGFPYYDYDRLNAFLETLAYFFNHTHGVRRLGSAATDLAYVACGRFEAFYEYSLHPWDVAAGALLVKNAGGTVSDFSGNNAYVFGKEIIASNEAVYAEFLKIVKTHMGD